MGAGLSRHGIVVIAGSAGAFEPLIELCRSFEKDIPAAVFVVLHGADAEVLSEILNRNGPLKASSAKNGAAIRPGRIYIARADRQLLIQDAHQRVFRGPGGNGFRPAADSLFQTAALAYGRRVVGVVLSGALDDGTLGLFQVKKMGGVAVVQSPEEAVTPSMPSNAIRNNSVDYVVPVSQMAGIIDRITREKARDTERNPANHPDVLEAGMENHGIPKSAGPPTPLTCPDCGSTLWATPNDQPTGYRCYEGHGFSPETLLTGKSDEYEAALWIAVRALQEKATIHRRLAERFKRLRTIFQGHTTHAEEAERNAEAIRRLLSSTRKAKHAREATTSHPRRRKR